MSKPSVKPSGYNHSYGKIPPPQRAPRPQFQAKKSFADALGAAEKNSFDVMNIISGMKTLRKDEKQKDNHEVKKKEKPVNRVQPQPNVQQQFHQQRPHAAQVEKPTTEKFVMNPTVEQYLGQEVASRRTGRKFKVLIRTAYDKFRCMICQVAIIGQDNVLNHWETPKHLRAKEYYRNFGPSPPPPGGSAKRPSQGGSGPHFRARQQHHEPPRIPSPRVENSPGNVSDEYRPACDDNYDDYEPLDDPGSPMQQDPPPIAALLPKPVPALPKPVPTLGNQLQPTDTVNPSIFQIPGLEPMEVPGLSPPRAAVSPPLVNDEYDDGGASPPLFDRSPLRVGEDLFPEPPHRVETPPQPVPAPIGVPIPTPVPPPVIPTPVPAPTLSLANLKKLPTGMSMEDRVQKLQKSQEETDWQRAREARNKIKTPQIDKIVDDDDEPYTPPGLSDDEGSPQTPPMPSKEPSMEFNIDTTKSFFDTTPTKKATIPTAKVQIIEGLRVKPLEKMMASPSDNIMEPAKVKKEILEEPPEPPKAAKSSTTKTKKGSFFDKVIAALKKNQPSMQLPSMNMDDDDTPPLPPGPHQPPLPPLPPSDSALADFLDDDEVLKLVSDLDKDMAEEEKSAKLAKAKEKLNQILARKINQQPPLPPTPAGPPPSQRSHVPGPRSRMAVPPEPAYRAGPRSRLTNLNPTLLAATPPPPPPPEDQPPAPPAASRNNITDDEISSFMNQWQGHDEASKPVAEAAPVYSSALAKLRAKKAAKAKQRGGNQPPPSLLSLNVENPSQPPPSLLSLNFENPTEFLPQNFEPLPPRPFENVEVIEKNMHSRIFRAWEKLLERYWPRLMEEMFNEIWVSLSSAQTPPENRLEMNSFSFNSFSNFHISFLLQVKNFVIRDLQKYL